jgi:hypothetical protein
VAAGYEEGGFEYVVGAAEKAGLKPEDVFDG